MKKLRIGIVGCGAIGGSLAASIIKDFKAQARLGALHDCFPERAEGLVKKLSLDKKTAVRDLARLISKSDLIIEAASAHDSLKIARSAVSRRKDILILSVGGLVNGVKELRAMAKRTGSKIYIPSGAIAGIDALKAASLKNIKSITLTTRKNPRSFLGVEYVSRRGIDLGRIKTDRVIFLGSAARAVRLFPKNINVAAILGIAGVGIESTRVRLIASPKVKRNIHEIMIESESARIFTRTENLLHPKNPKTSYLAVLSAVATLKQILEPIKIGT